ncbi:hypothetical protein TKK_0010993 [Trichogramma kaykai]|uniref:Protein-lysine N-methyltransferase TKK_009462 n=1 Tax=Trichogramma kaykai TaxID=54128 RepID=A0ABD2WU47_9HYME
MSTIKEVQYPESGKTEKVENVESEETEELKSSELGTKDYWEETYSQELENFEDHGDVGEIWFGERSSKTMVKYIADKVPKTARIIDLGCGNGVSLKHLRDAGYETLYGADYSLKAIELARKVLDEDKYKGIELLVSDITKPTSFTLKFDLVFDKGTYDAISLSPDNASMKRRQYLENVRDMLTVDGYLAITSCNWTKSELMDHFKDLFELEKEIQQPTIKFGGQTGSHIVQLVFKKHR